MIAAGGGASRSTVTGELAAFAAWVGENNYNYFAAIRRGTPGFGPLDIVRRDPPRTASQFASPWSENIGEALQTRGQTIPFRYPSANTRLRIFPTNRAKIFPLE